MYKIFKKYESFKEGFDSFMLALKHRNDEDIRDFWEEINIGWMREYIYPHDDWYSLSISKERKLRLAQELEKIYVSEEAYYELLEILNKDSQN